MLKKLLKNLPFNPSLIEHVPDHIKALRKDQKIRIAALIFFLMAIGVQVFITASPSQPTLTNSPNDLMNGGFSSQNEAVSDCKNNVSNYSDILKSFSVSCTDISNATTTTIKSTDSNNQLYSINRLAYGKPSETAIQIGGQTFWSRNLNSWDSVQPSSYKVLSGTNDKKQSFYLIYSSANLIVVGQPKTNVEASSCAQKVAVSCVNQSVSVRDQTSGITDANNNTVKPGDELVYTVASNNSSPNVITGYIQKINASNLLAYAGLNSSYGGKLSSGFISWPAKTLKAGQTLTNQFSMFVSNPIPKTPISSTDPGYFNSSMTVAYGNVLTVKLPFTFNKYVESSVNNGLPYENKWASLVAVIGIAVIMLYFIALNHLVVEELHKIKDDFSNNDGR
jgi:hypothetical protein